MAEKNVSVKLSANTAAYKKGMSEATAATKDFESKSGANLQQLGTKMSAVGSSMTRSVTLPLIALGAGAVKLSMDFDASMSKIVALVGIAGGEVDGMKDAVLELAGETATAPKELADALFVLTSAGLRGDDALSALEMSAKASAAGLGETNDIARAVAGAMNAYGPGALDAARATDILTATARAGNFETSQLAGALGRVLPFAKQAQASFEDVGGAVALLTRTNGNATESITQVQALMRAFVVPTAEAAKALDAVGLSAEDVRNSIGENGLVPTLQMLDEKLGGNREQLGRLLGSSEAASAAFQILDADAQTIADTFGVTASAAGMTDEAFTTMSETGAFKTKQAFEDVKIALIQVGEIIGPLVADVAGGISSIVDAFSKLPQGAQVAVVAFLGILAAVGPLLTIGGKILISFKAITAGLTMMKVAMLGHPLLLLATVAATVGAALFVLSNKTDSTAKSIDEMAEAMKNAGNAGDGLAEWLMSTSGRSDLLAPLLDSLGLTVSDLADAATEGGPAWTAMAVQLAAAGDAANLTEIEQAGLNTVLANLPGIASEAADKAAMLARVTGESGDAADGAAEANDGLAEAQLTAAEAAEEAAEAQQEYIDSVLDAVSAVFDYERANLSLRDAVADFADEQQNATDVLEDGKSTDAEKAQAMRDLRGAHLDTAGAALALAEAYAVEMGAVDGTRHSAQLQIDKLSELADEYPQLRSEIGTYIAKLLEVPATVDTKVSADTLEAMGAINDVAWALGGLDGRTARVRVDTIYQRPGMPATARAAGGPMFAGRLYEVGEGNVAEMFVSAGRQYMVPGNDGHMISGPQMAAGGGGGGMMQTNTIYTQQPQGVRQELEALAWAAGAR